MGYTHYWRLNPKGDDERYGAALAELQAIVKASPVRLRGPLGEGRPEVGDGIAFNGDTESGQDYETFALEANLRDVRIIVSASDGGDERGFGCCKTAQRPYDVAVCAVLATMSARCKGDVTISSDGDATEWLEGVKLAREALRDPTIPLPEGLRDLSRFVDSYQQEAARDLALADAELARHAAVLATA